MSSVLRSSLIEDSAWLSGGEYRLFLTRRGTGFSAHRKYLLTGWNPDPVEDRSGFAIYVRDLDSHEYWTASSAPLPGHDVGRLIILPGTASIQRFHEGISSRVDVRIDAESAMEVRQITLTNTRKTRCRLEITSYIEIVLNEAQAHAAHPAFSKLFVQTEWLPALNAIVARRRARSNSEKHPALVHGLLGAIASEFETDRVRFLGRGRDASCPQALTGDSTLSGMAGSVLDPVMSLRTVLELQPDESRQVCFLLGAAVDQHMLSRCLENWGKHNVKTIPPQTHLDGQETWKQALSGGNGDIWRRLTVGYNRARKSSGELPAAKPSAIDVRQNDSNQAESLQFFNGYGGFNADGSEYVIRLPRDESGRTILPPMPWTNVIANEHCGILVSEKGAGTMWNRNSRLNRLTPWRNDPVSDPHDDAFYIRDEDNGEFWSPLPGPVAALADFEVRHGFGYSTWRHSANDLAQDVCLFVPEDDPLRIARIRVRNTGSITRRLSFYAYNRWVLGTTPEETAAKVVTEFNAEMQAVLARNPESGEFSDGVAFAASDHIVPINWSADRDAFLGCPGSISNPAAFRQESGQDGRAGGVLSESTGVDPCAVLRVELEIKPGETGQVAFFLGETISVPVLSELLQAYRRAGAVNAALAQAKNFWKQTLGTLKITTPSPVLDLMINGWLSYQNLSCRLWARTAFYQSGGAFGFRDQMQDAASLITLRPDIARRQILINAAHQFVEGDVLHWWHPPLSKGIRTLFADDLLWMPYLTAHYVNTTGDQSVMAESVRFIKGEPLPAGEDELFMVPEDSGQRADVYEHCCRALDRSLTRGAHGIPLFGCGDWNDGMNRVGREGRGESVWMGFFLYTILGDFLPCCEARNDSVRVASYRTYRSELLKSLNDAAWDGEWYRRAWYDNGMPLGSKESDECKIDALAQAWAIISKAAPDARANVALDALEKHLISDKDQLIRLLTPPFVDTPNDPGYIKGYVAGVRENGGQYTHAALWVVKAMAEAGRRDRAMQLMEMLNPISHSKTREDADRYMVEPYVIAADIYGVEPHVGRGGWTWYTGSAGWMFRVTTETLLGFSIHNGDAIKLNPRIPDNWPEYRIDHRREDGTRYSIEVANPQHSAQKIVSACLDGFPLEVDTDGVRIPLVQDGLAHHVRVTMGP